MSFLGNLVTAGGAALGAVIFFALSFYALCWPMSVSIGLALLGGAVGYLVTILLISYSIMRGGL